MFTILSWLMLIIRNESYFHCGAYARARVEMFHMCLLVMTRVECCQLVLWERAMWFGKYWPIQVYTAV